jgi:CubicO group peptidase (beta-lactamase class C family)
MFFPTGYMPIYNPSLEHPLDFNHLASPESVGMSPAGVHRILQVFEDQLARGLHPGAQLVVLRYGQVVVDFARGIANLHRNTPVLPSTPFLTWSTSKPFTAMCIHQLGEQGKIDLDSPIAHYWPEFGCKGKETATVRHALLHQAGIPMRGLYTQVILWSRWNLVTRNVAALRAEYPPGTRTAYHAVNFGFILGEIVRRVSGLPIRVYLHGNFLQPIGLKNTALGLPVAWRSRAAGIYSGEKEQNGAVFLFNLPRIRRAVIPAATLHSTARDLAAFFQMLVNGGMYAGQRYLNSETVQTAVTLGYEGLDQTIGHTLRWALGFQTGGLSPGEDPDLLSFGRQSTRRTFGHPGQRSCIAWADPDAHLVLAFVCNRLETMEGSRRRWAELANAAWDAVQN